MYYEHEQPPILHEALGGPRQKLPLALIVFGQALDHLRRLVVFWFVLSVSSVCIECLPNAVWSFFCFRFGALALGHIYAFWCGKKESDCLVV